MVNLIGHKFGRLTVISFNEKRDGHMTYWNCECSCGNKKIISRSSLKSGRSNSCGCLNAETVRRNFGTHLEASGKNRTKEYRTWCHMKRRCYLITHPHFKDYGGRGIKVDRKWKNSYENFLIDMGRAPSPKHSIERRNNNKGYSKNNCYWATMKEQSNNRRKNRIILFDGQKKTLSQWCDQFNMGYKLVSDRINRYGWSLKKALTTPKMF
jgi:hypothetical protein